MSVSEILKEKAELFEAKQKEYGSTYLMYGEVMKSLFPEGITIKTVDDWNEFGILNMIVHKITRITSTGLKSLDSIKDLQVYGAILEELKTNK